MCAGIKKDCDSVLACTYHAFGPCGGGLEEPSMYMEVHLDSFLALLDPEAYLTDASQVEAVPPSYISENGYRRFSISNGENAEFLKSSANAPGAGYAHHQTGAFFGKDPSVSGSWLGVSSYLLTKGNMTTRTNSFIFPTEPGQPREDADSVDACVSDLAFDPLSCGTARSYFEGEFKYSLLGVTLGSDFSAGEDVKGFGIRTKVDLVGTDTAHLTLNDGETLESIGSTDITKLVLREKGGGGRELTIEFPTAYNVGIADPDGFMIPSDTKVVQVKVSQVIKEGQSLSSMATMSSVESIYVDYLFWMPGVSGKYVLYDPRVVDSTAPSILESLTPSFVFDPIKMAFGLTIVIYFVGCNFFICTSDCASNVCTKIV
jgi:hypothetical protein